MSDKINPLHRQLATLYRLSPKNSKLSHLVTEAKTALGITSPKRLTDNEQQAVYQWHVKNISQMNQSSDCDTVENISQLNDSVKVYSQPIDNEAVNILSQDASNDDVNIFSQQRIGL